MSSSSSYLNLAIFLLSTFFYYLAIKPTFTYDIFKDTTLTEAYNQQNFMCLGIYLLLIVVSQFIVNISIIAGKCGGSMSENMGTAGIYTFIPWILIFGITIAILIIYPGFKTAFSDVIGYYYVSSSANKILSDLLIDTKIQPLIDNSTDNKESLQTAADAIIKIFGNSSLLINQITPPQFNKYWSILNPLMKPIYQTESGETDTIKKRLFDLVVTRDNVGEIMWFLYAGIIVVSLIQLKISSSACKMSPQTMEQNYAKFVANENAAQAKADSSTSAVYTVT